MQLGIKLAPKLSPKLKLTPYLRLSLGLLQLPLLKLKEFISQQVEENPLLDLQHPASLPGKNYNSGQKQNYRQALIIKPITLQEHLLKQLRIRVNSENELKIGKLIIGSLNDNAYLRCSTQELADSIKTTSTKIAKVLSLIQTFDPPGSGAKNLRECLLIQLKLKGRKNSLAGQIIDKYLLFLEKKKYKPLTK